MRQDTTTLACRAPGPASRMSRHLPQCVRLACCGHPRRLRWKPLVPSILACPMSAGPRVNVKVSAPVGRRRRPSRQRASWRRALQLEGDRAGVPLTERRAFCPLYPDSRCSPVQATRGTAAAQDHAVYDDLPGACSASTSHERTGSGTLVTAVGASCPAGAAGRQSARSTHVAWREPDGPVRSLC